MAAAYPAWHDQHKASLFQDLLGVTIPGGLMTHESSR